MSHSSVSKSQGKSVKHKAVHTTCVFHTFLTQRLLCCLQTVAQDFSEYVTSTKTKLNEDETLSVLKSVMKMCSEITSSKNQVSLFSSLCYEDKCVLEKQELLFIQKPGIKPTKIGDGSR